MSFIVNHNTGTDTPIPGVSSLTLTRGLVNYKADWRIKEDEPEQFILTNLNAPVAYSESFRWAVSDIENIYKNTGITSNLYSPTRKGVNLLIQNVETWTVTDTEDTTYNVALPIEGHIVLKLPEDPAITVDDILTFIGRLVSGLFDTGSETGTRIQAFMRRSLRPSDM